MADRNGTDLAWELRRIVAGRRRRRRRIALSAMAGCAAAPLFASIIWKPPLLLAWNVSESAPVGLYRVEPNAPVRRGDMVIAWIPEPARTLAARRHYLPANVPLVKRVAAAAGDTVCANRRAVAINGRIAALRQESDPFGRPMPWWTGCRDLRTHEYFLLTDSTLSFDGRYFGVSGDTDVLGRARLLWAKPAKGPGDE